MVNKKTIQKISWELFNTDYYIIPIYSKNEVVEWTLYLSNDDINEKDSIMLSSKNNSIEELKKFVKKRKDINEVKGYFSWQIIVAFICLAILIVVSFINIDKTIKFAIRTSIIVLDIYMFISSFILSHLQDKKWKHDIIRSKDKLNILQQLVEEKISNFNQKMEGEKNGTRHVSSKKEKRGKEKQQ